MSSLTPTDFTAFFESVHGYEPFPWQRMLLKHVTDRDWPEGINLPTASGKTSCIDIAVFLLALGAEQGRLQRHHPARRRIFFVVDRRIVVDEAYDRALRLAKKLSNEKEGVVHDVADRLRELAGCATPLVVSRLRGGTLRDDSWRINPTQPAVITSTVDQVGSRLLFRSYGSGTRSAPIEAGLTGCDSLILLDEAHCAVPFLQTARSVRRYAGPDWTTSEKPLASSMTLSILSATLPEEVKDVFPTPEKRSAALGSEVLRTRVTASKPAEIVHAKRPAKRNWTLGEAVSDDPLVCDAAQRAADLAARQEHNRIAIMVNRVNTAGTIHQQLQTAVEAGHLDANVALMTGRMRPLDRDQLVGQWEPLLKAGTDRRPDRPVILVATQCLEVGADFSFDALITECAALDALRQRFGRLNRLGEFPSVCAAILIRKKDVKPDDKLKENEPLDPIYGNATARTWNWLTENAKDACVDFSIERLEEQLPDDPHRLARMHAPSPDAPVLLPAHVDLLSQTAPRPAPDPDVSVFLHGPDRGIPTAGVVFRSDLPKDTRTWAEAVTLLPPLTGETLAVPLHLLRRWLGRESIEEQLRQLSDVEGQAKPDVTEQPASGRPFVIWRGHQDTLLSRRPEDVRPNETVVVPADEELANQLQHAFTRPKSAPLDIAEPAYQAAGKRHVLRLVSPVLDAWPDVEPLAALLSWACDEERSPRELPDLLGALADYSPAEDETHLPPWMKDTARALAQGSPQVEPHPCRGCLVFVRMKGALDFDTGDDDDALSASHQDVSLTAHTQHVLETAQQWATRCLPAEAGQPVVNAARLHDLGKADPRFQIVLHGDEIEAAIAVTRRRLLAKSRGPGRSPSEDRRLRRIAELPHRFRHEMLSVQLAEALGMITETTELRELILHLIAAHHGHARPFAPVVEDGEFPAVQVELDGASFEMTPEQRAALTPPHRLDSGVPDRFWRLTRHFGWWQLAYLEAVFRLADRSASARESAGSAAAAAQEVSS